MRLGPPAGAAPAPQVGGGWTNVRNNALSELPTDAGSVRGPAILDTSMSGGFNRSAGAQQLTSLRGEGSNFGTAVSTAPSVHDSAPEVTPALELSDAKDSAMRRIASILAGNGGGAASRFGRDSVAPGRMSLGSVVSAARRTGASWASRAKAVVDVRHATPFQARLRSVCYA